MSELALRPDGHPGYVHHSVRLEQAVRDQMDGQVIQPMTYREFLEQQTRDVSADPNDGIADVFYDEEAGLITFTMDTRVAGIVIHAVRQLAAEKEAHKREVMAVAERMPEGSWGRKNREEIATRLGRIARPCRSLERAYQDVIDKEYFGF